MRSKGYIRMKMKERGGENLIKYIEKFRMSFLRFVHKLYAVLVLLGHLV